MQRSPLKVGLYISFFPQLIAGPIVKYETVAQQIDHRKEIWADFSAGCSRFIVGLGKKVLLSNQLAVVADRAFGQGDGLSASFAWLGALCYTLQIYYDFSGYSDMAIGLGKMFGFHFLENFNYPYISRSITEFWRRWHISLSTWFRDYVYFPLGGSRVNSKAKHIRNLFVVWLLTGVWHGANWTFLAWGLFYFVLLVLEKYGGLGRGWPVWAKWLFTFLMVNFAWVLFRADSLAAAGQYLQAMFGLGAGGWDDLTALYLRENWTVVAAGFLLLATSFFGGEGKFEALLKTFLRERDVMAFVDGAETAVNGDLDRDHLFIQLYGGVQRLSGRRVVEDAVGENTVVRLSTGGLNFVDLQAAPGVGPQVAENAAATAAFAQSLEALGIPYLYVNAPQKLQRGEALLPTGVEEYGNESADAFLEELERQGTDYVDLRPLFEENGIYSNWFFRTDHHWKPEAAFFAWQALTDELEERYGLAADPALTDPANWDTRVLEHFFLGSQGKRVGSLYAGADDITLYTPKFDSELTYSCPAYGFTRTGPFETSVCFPERVAQQDWFNGNPYTYYAGGDYPIATITNHKNPDGPRVVLLRDSFACALTPFLALSCSELTTIDLRYFEGDLLDTIAGLEPDIALTLYAASTTRLDNLFQYEHTEE